MGQVTKEAIILSPCRLNAETILIRTNQMMHEISFNIINKLNELCWYRLKHFICMCVCKCAINYFLHNKLLVQFDLLRNCFVIMCRHASDLLYSDQLGHIPLLLLDHQTTKPLRFEQVRFLILKFELCIDDFVMKQLNQ